MELHLTGKTFCVGGVTSGLGLAVTERLLQEGAAVVGVARTEADLNELAARLGPRLTPFVADLTDEAAVDRLSELLAGLTLTGCVLNAGGPPTGRAEDLSMTEWDAAYAGTLRWKVQLTRALLPALKKQEHGRLLFVESVSIKQPIDNLALSNAMRAAVAGYVKTLSREVGESGLTVNILAPGYHATPRITTVLEQSAELQGVTLSETERAFTAETAMRRLGDPADLAALAAYLLSPLGRYVTGQTITVDGGLVRHITG